VFQIDSGVVVGFRFRCRCFREGAEGLVR
jgi:hypothetical protein